MAIWRSFQSDSNFKDKETGCRRMKEDEHHNMYLNDNIAFKALLYLPFAQRQ